MLAEAQESSLVTTIVVLEFSLGTVPLWAVELVWARASEVRKGIVRVESFMVDGAEVDDKNGAHQWVYVDYDDGTGTIETRRIENQPESASDWLCSGSI